MARRDDSKRSEAARVYQATRNISEAARQAGVHRTTVQRWVNEPDFLTDVEEDVEFDDLIPKAVRVLNDALEGKKITSAQIRSAIEVWKSSKSLQTVVSGPGLADLIAELDSEEGSVDSD